MSIEDQSLLSTLFTQPQQGTTNSSHPMSSLWHVFGNLHFLELLEKTLLVVLTKLTVSNNSLSLSTILREPLPTSLCLHYPQLSKLALPFQTKPNLSEWSRCMVA